MRFSPIHLKVVRGDDGMLAVIRWQGREENLLQNIKKAVTRWVNETGQGKLTLERNGGSFNIGDLANENLELTPLDFMLQNEGVHALEINIIPDVQDEWEFDTRLYNEG